MMIQRELNDPRVTGLPSITRVKVSQDLSYADVYVSVMGTTSQQKLTLAALRHSAGMMRGRLTRDLSLREAPYIRFHLDDNLKKEIEVLELLHKVAEENAEIDRQRADQGEAAEGDEGDSGQ